MSHTVRALVTLALLASAGSALGAADEPPGPAAPPTAATPAAPAATEAAPKRFSLSVKEEGPRVVFDLIARAVDERILVDSSVQGGRVTADWKDATLDEALTEACKQLGVAWKRVYVPPHTALVPDNVSQIYRTLRSLVAGGLVALEPGDDKASMLLLNAPLPANFRGVMEQPNTGFRRCVLVLNERVPLQTAHSPAADEESGAWQPGQPLTPRRMAALSRGLLVAMAQMSPEQRQAAMQMSLESQMEILSQNPQLLGQFVRESTGMQMQFMMRNPEMLQGVMQAAMQAQISAIQQMSPEQRQMLVQIQLQTLRSIPPDQMQQLMQLFGGGRR